MAVFQTKAFIKHDDYMTPFNAWDCIKHLIPKDKIVVILIVFIIAGK
jgi:hypothetical protein